MSNERPRNHNKMDVTQRFVKPRASRAACVTAEAAATAATAASACARAKVAPRRPVCVRSCLLRACVSFLFLPSTDTRARRLTFIRAHTTSHRRHAFILVSPLLLSPLPCPIVTDALHEWPTRVESGHDLSSQKRHNSTRPHTSVSATLPSKVYLIFGHLSHLRPPSSATTPITLIE